MSVNIAWSLSNNGTEITQLNHGDAEAGVTTSGLQVYISHDGETSITNCKFWLDVVGSYTGDADASSDLSEIIEWGNTTTVSGFGGILLNMDATGSFPETSWSTYDDRYGTSYGVFSGAHGDVAISGITLPTTMSSEMTVAGVIPADMASWPSFKTKVKVPILEDTTGVRQVTQKLRYTYTS